MANQNHCACCKPTKRMQAGKSLHLPHQISLLAGFDSAGKASLVMNVNLLVQLLFAGYFTDLDRVTPILRWLRWLSAFYYGFESLVVNEISGLSFDFEVAPSLVPVHHAMQAGQPDGVQ